MRGRFRAVTAPSRRKIQKALRRAPPDYHRLSESRVMARFLVGYWRL